MLMDLTTRVEGIDVDKSAFLTRFGFATKDTVYQCITAADFVKNFNSVFGKVLDANGTRTAGGRGKVIITFLDNPSPKVSVEEVTLSESLLDTPMPPSEVLQNNIGKADTLTEATEATETFDAPASEGVVEEDVQADTTTSPEKPDLEYAESLKEGKSKSEAKEALAAYALTFGITISTSKKFENMLIDLMA